MTMDLLLKNLSWHNGNRKISGDVRISGETISETGENLFPKTGELVEHFDGDYLYPGLINAHDHLEMNVYPKLGNPPYQNYVEWAKDIYNPKQSPIREIEKIDIKTRLAWGGLKNLISGATTVVHHNPWHGLLGKSKFPVNVPEIYWAHSLALEKNLSKKIPYDNKAPFVIHAAEGVDTLAFSEITALDALKILTNDTVLVHSIALSDEQIQLLAARQCAVVWCPASNLYMFNQTAFINKLKYKVKLLLGSDSTLTGSPTLLHEMKAAQKTQLATPFEIHAMVSNTPALVFNLPNPSIATRCLADFFIAPSIKEDYFENLLAVEPRDISLVVRRGLPRLINATKDWQWSKLKHPVTVQGVQKSCDVDVPSLRREIAKKVPSEILERNALWNLLKE